jgi:hypothetical protein
MVTLFFTIGALLGMLVIAASVTYGWSGWWVLGVLPFGILAAVIDEKRSR